MLTTMRKRGRDAYRYGLASATDVWTRDRAVVDGLSRVAAAGWLRRGRGRGLLGILRQSLAPAGAAERASWCRGIQQRNRTARGGNSLQSIHTHTHPPRGHRYAALATKSCGALVTAAASEIQPRPFVRTGTGCPESAAAARVHGRYHVITMYNPQSPFMRLHVPIREECCEIGRVCFGCASVQLWHLFSHLLTPPLSAEGGGGATTKPGRTSQVADHHHSKITCTPRPTSSLYTLIITTLSVPPLSSPLASLVFPCSSRGPSLCCQPFEVDFLQVICQAWRSKRGGIQVTHRYRVKLTRSFLV